MPDLTAAAARPPRGILTQPEFEQYGAEWLRVVSGPDAAELQQSFRPAAAAAAGADAAKAAPLLCSVSFPTKQMARLVSTVGATHIKARFGIRPGAANGAGPQFTLALFATNALEARVSSYYLADEAPLPGADGPDPADEVQLLDEVPDGLAHFWVRNWARTFRAAPVTADMFATPYGPLQGYTFEVTDFISTLWPVTDFDQEDVRLRVRFGLHEFYQPQPDGTDRLVHTFGLVLQLWPPTQVDEDGEPVVEDPFYDFSMPNPPGSIGGN